MHVDLGRGRSRSGDELSWEVWLDPARDWLPRRMVTRSSTDEGVRSYLHEVTRFRSIPDRLLGRDRWFPDQFFGRHLAREDYKVLQMTVNEPSPPNLFTIEPQPGTEVAEIDPNNPRATRIWIQGGSAALADIRTEVIEEAREMAANGGPAADASPPTSSNLTLYGWLLAALLGIAALLIWWRQ